MRDVWAGARRRSWHSSSHSRSGRLAFLAALALGSRFSVAGVIVGAAMPFVLGAGLLLWLGRRAGRQWPAVIVAIALGVFAGLIALAIEFFLYYSVSSVYL